MQNGYFSMFKIKFLALLWCSVAKLANSYMNARSLIMQTMNLTFNQKAPLQISAL